MTCHSQTIKFKTENSIVGFNAISVCRYPLEELKTMKHAVGISSFYFVFYECYVASAAAGTELFLSASSRAGYSYPLYCS